MNDYVTIGELAKSGDVPVSTLRYYERLGLLVADARSDGNYRIYGPKARERLEFIRSAKDAGFTLEDITELINIREGTIAACDDVRVVIERRLEDLDHRLRDLRRLRRALTTLQQTCREAGNRDHCLVLEELGEGHRTS